MNALTVIEHAHAALPAELTSVLELARDFARASKSKATIKAYASDWRAYEAFCAASLMPALPVTPPKLCGFLARARLCWLGRAARMNSRMISVD
jgi:hypothetical protein